MHVARGDAVKLRARLHNRQIMAHHLSDEDWEEIRAISRKQGGRGLKMHCCDVRAVPKHTPGGQRRYFAHFGKAEACEWIGETEAHIEAKMAALTAAAALGWTADAEVTRAAWLDREPDLKAARGPCEEGRDWEADVLAVRGGKLKVRVAIEIQRSGQGRSETRYRDERYTNDGILPFWVFFSRFAASKQDTHWKVVLPQGDVVTVAAAAGKAVVDFLRLIEGQNRIAEAVIGALRHLGIPYELEHLHNVPVMVRARRGDDVQDILFGEIGAFTKDEEEAPKQLAGAEVIFVEHADQPKDVGVIAHFIRGDRNAFVRKRLTDIFEGRLVWRSRDHKENLPATLVGYDDTCHSCGQPHYHVLGCLYGHTVQRADCRPQFKTPDQGPEFLLECIERFEKRTGKRCSTFDRYYYRGPRCPHCGWHMEPLIKVADVPEWPGLDGVPAWPYTEVHFPVRSKLPGKGWQAPPAKVTRRSPPHELWEGFVAAKIAERDEKQRQAEERQRQEAEVRERHRLAREAEEERRRQEAEAAAKAACDSRQAQLDAVVEKVLILADAEDESAWDRGEWMARSLTDLQLPSPRRLIDDGGSDFTVLLDYLQDLARLPRRRRSIPSSMLGLPIARAMAEAAEAAAEVRVSDLRDHATSTFSGEIDPTAWLSAPHDALGRHSPIDAARDSVQGFQEAWDAVSAQGDWLGARRWRRQRLRDEAARAFPRSDPQRVSFLVETPCREIGMRRMIDMCGDEEGLKACLAALDKIKKSRKSL